MYKARRGSLKAGPGTATLSRYFLEVRQKFCTVVTIFLGNLKQLYDVSHVRNLFLLLFRSCSGLLAELSHLAAADYSTCGGHSPPCGVQISVIIICVNPVRVRL